MTKKTIPQATNKNDKKKKDHLFKPGQIANPKGRPKGARSVFSTDFVKAFHDDFLQHGKQVIIDVRESKPDVYLKCAVAILPKIIDVDVDVEVKKTVKHELGVDAIQAKREQLMIAAKKKDKESRAH